MNRNWHAGPASGVGSGSNEEAVGELDGPREELKDQRGSCLFRGTNKTQDLLSVIGDGGQHTVFAFFSGLENLKMAICRLPLV
ncbi:hypothetical protein HG530_011623 [Fusarium avenaceum]|nr:hypothetical protein HG530_011623 [Fusarium avenaceum]